VTGYLLWAQRKCRRWLNDPVFGTNGFHHPWRSTAWEIHPVMEIEVID
jgi:hypothetical protein